MEKTRASLPLAVTAMATLLSATDSRAILDPYIPNAHSASQLAWRDSIVGLVHYARAKIQRECSIDWLIYTDRAIESDYRRERDDSEIGQDHCGEDYVRVTREVVIDAGRMDCAKRIIEVINREKGLIFNAGLSVGSDGITAYSPRPTFVSI